MTETTITMQDLIIVLQRFIDFKVEIGVVMKHDEKQTIIIIDHVKIPYGIPLTKVDGVE